MWTRLLRFTLYIVGLINSRLILDMSGNAFLIGWARVSYWIVMDVVTYVCAYRGYKNLKTSMTLLHIVGIKLSQS